VERTVAPTTERNLIQIGLLAGALAVLAAVSATSLSRPR